MPVTPWYPHLVNAVAHAWHRHAAALRRALLVLVAGAIVVAIAPPAAAQQASNAVWLVPIETEITAATAQFVRARVDRANRELPLALVFYLDTPGGQISAMQRIVEDVLNRSQVPTLAIVRNAYSAGALIAMAAEQVAMLPGSAIGAATPILVTPIGISPVDEKMSSAMRGEFRAVAEARGRDARIAEGMVDARIELPGIASGDELITLTGAQAVEYGIADIEARTVQEALERFGYAGVRIERLEPNLTERVGTWLAAPVIVAILLVLGVGGLLLEFFSPGFGIPGGIGLLALALLGLTAVVATPAGPLDLLLILAGIVLLAVEALLIPGFGVAGVLGIGVLAFAVFRVFQESWLMVLGTSTVLAGALLAVLLWYLPYSRVASRLRLATRIGRTPFDPTVTPGRAGERSDLVGLEGIALTDLRPSGLARVGDERVDVVTLGDFISNGTPIRVVRVAGNRVTVRAIENSAASAEAAGRLT
jgi:membrane-bound serine protease (ClpP class)